MVRVAHFLLLGVALAFVVVSIHGLNYTEDGSFESEEIGDDSSSNGSEAVVPGQESDESDDSDESEDEDDYVNDGGYFDYNQDEGDTDDETDIEEEQVESVDEEKPAYVPLPPCQPEHMFKQLDKVCAKYRDEDITELEKKCEEIDMGIVDIHDLISKSSSEASFLIEKDDTTWTEKLSYPAILAKEHDRVEIDYNEVADDSISDCNDALGKGHKKPGVYLLNPNSPYNVRALCVNGWTVIQRRFDGTENFNRDFDEYVSGFGNFSGEFILGLENLHRLTKDNSYTLRIDVKGSTGKWYYAVYEDFSLSDEQDQYRLLVGNMTAGNFFDGLDNGRNEQFSTYDRDNDMWGNGNCAKHYGGGWWSSTCNTNLNQVWCRSGCLQWASKRVISSIMRIKPSEAIVPEDVSENPNPGGLTLDETPA